MSCGLTQFGLQLAPLDAIEPGPIRDGFAAMNKAVTDLYQMLAPGRPIHDELDGAFVRDDADGALVRGPVNLWGVQVLVPPAPAPGHPGRPGDPGPAGPPGPPGDPGGWYSGSVLVYQPGGGGGPYVVQGPVTPTYLIPHIHGPLLPGTYGIDGIRWSDLGAPDPYPGVGYANVADGAEKKAMTGPMIDDGGGQHHHELWMTVREAWDILKNSGPAIAS